MNHPESGISRQKIKVREQICGTVALTREIAMNFYRIIETIYEDFDPQFRTDFLIIKTVAMVQGKKYKSGDLINISDEILIQTVTLQYPWKAKKSHRLAVPMKGFPINAELFNPLIYAKMLSKKYLY